jgi:hypothetical protein
MALSRFTDTAKASWKFVEFIDAIKLVYESTPPSDRGLREIVIQLVVEHGKILVKDGEPQAKLFAAMMMEVGEFGMDMTKRLLSGKSPSSVQRYMDSEWSH